MPFLRRCRDQLLPDLAIVLKDQISSDRMPFFSERSATAGCDDLIDIPILDGRPGASIRFLSERAEVEAVPIRRSIGIRTDLKRRMQHIRTESVMGYQLDGARGRCICSEMKAG